MDDDAVDGPVGSGLGGNIWLAVGGAFALWAKATGGTGAARDTGGTVSLDLIVDSDTPAEVACISGSSGPDKDRPDILVKVVVGSLIPSSLASLATSVLASVLTFVEA